MGFYDRNVIALTNASGLKAWYEYSPFGGTLTASGDAAELNPFRFSSEYADSETGLIYYNYRYYNPELGRWLSRDPIAEEGGENLYAMARNNTINKLDFLGLNVDCCGDQKYDSSSQCCVNKVIESKVTDDAGNKCCKHEMKSVEILVEPMFDGNGTGHVSVSPPTQLAGYHPNREHSWASNAWLAGEGMVKDELDRSGKEKYKYDPRNSYTYNACPETYKKIDAAIEVTRKDPPWFDGTNIFARNCAGMACQWVEHGGLVAPYAPDTYTLAPAPPGERGYGSGRKPKN